MKPHNLAARSVRFVPNLIPGVGPIIGYILKKLLDKLVEALINQQVEKTIGGDERCIISRNKLTVGLDRVGATPSIGLRRAAPRIGSPVLAGAPAGSGCGYRGRRRRPLQPHMALPLPHSRRGVLYTS